jgi:hypothetical protein
VSCLPEREDRARRARGRRRGNDQVAASVRGVWDRFLVRAKAGPRSAATPLVGVSIRGLYRAPARCVVPVVRGADHSECGDAWRHRVPRGVLATAGRAAEEERRTKADGPFLPRRVETTSSMASALTQYRPASADTSHARPALHMHIGQDRQRTTRRNGHGTRLSRHGR